MRINLRINEDFEFWFYLSTFGKWGFIPKILFVSDGGDVTIKIGWLNKMKIRWENAPIIEKWEERIIERINNPVSNGFLKSRAIIAKDFAYSYILSHREDLSRKTILKFGKLFPIDRMSILLQFAAKDSLFCKIICQIFISREYDRHN